MTQLATLHRKNQGKQYTVVDDRRTIFHWHRPGEHLPKLLQHPSGSRFLLTQEKVDEALKHQRSKLPKIDTASGQVVPAVSYVNDKGGTVWELPKPPTLKDYAKSFGLYLAGSALAVGAAYEIAKVFA